MKTDCDTRLKDYAMVCMALVMPINDAAKSIKDGISQNSGVVTVYDMAAALIAAYGVTKTDDALKSALVFAGYSEDEVCRALNMPIPPQDREIFLMVRECAAALDGYYQKVRDAGFKNETVTLSYADMKKWKNVWYPKLSESGIIIDASFFQNPVQNKNYGIGADGVFFRIEYLQFMYRLYKYILADESAVFCSSGDYKLLLECAAMLEKYIGEFIGKGTADNEIIYFNEPDLTVWKTNYFPVFSQNEIIEDSSFFTVDDKPNYGIGNDGYFSCSELFHFLYRAERNMWIELHG